MPIFSYSWINLATMAVEGITPAISNLCAGEYELTVTDGNGCLSTPDTV